MNKIKDVIKKLDKLFPPQYAIKEDTVGLQIGSENNIYRGHVVSLDCDFDAINKAVKKNANLIICHHPIIYNSLEIELKSKYKRKIFELIKKHDLNIFVMHTNLDSAPNGLNDSILKYLDLEGDFYPISQDRLLWKHALLKNLTAKELINILKSKFPETQIILKHDANSKIKEFCFSSGAGSSYIEEVIKNNVNCFITSDFKWSNLIIAMQYNITIIEVSHNIENFITSLVKL